MKEILSPAESKALLVVASADEDMFDRTVALASGAVHTSPTSAHLTDAFARQWENGFGNRNCTVWTRVVEKQ